MKKSHFFHSELTTYLINSLHKGESVNLYGMSDSLLRRVLEDIENACIPEVHVAHLNIGTYYNSYSGFIRHLAMGLSDASANDLHSVIEQLLQRHSRIYLLLERFDKLFDNKKIDAQYDERFTDILNSVRNRPDVSLLIGTRECYRKNMMFIHGNPVTSNIDFSQSIALPEIGQKELLLEMKRQKIFRVQDESESKKLANHILQSAQDDPYGFLLFVAQKLNITGIPVPDEKSVSEWYESFRQEREKSLLRGVTELSGTAETLTGEGKFKKVFSLIGIWPKKI